MTEQAPKSDAESAQGRRLGIGLSLGLLFGVAFGVALDNLALGISVGMVMGIGFGMVGEARRERRTRALRDRGESTAGNVNGGSGVAPFPPFLAILCRRRSAPATCRVGAVPH